MKKVAILGGGVAGMSAAHELIERGFEVEVYEKQEIYVGGKARSINVPDTGTDGRKDLPGEHGFRFFPGFYKHVTDTMSRIPYPSPENSDANVEENLTVAKSMMMAAFGKTPIIMPTTFPTSLKEVVKIFEELFHSDTGLTKSDIEKFSAKIWQLMTSCYERRNEEYERISWWQFMDANQQCAGRGKDCPYITYFVGGMMHTLVAANPKLMSVKTGGDIFLQLLFLIMIPGHASDRVLNSPTNEAWLNPWYKYLRSKGVVYKHNHEVTRFECDVVNKSISKVYVEDKTTGEQKIVEADYYISAVPVEVMAPLVTEKMKAVDGTLGYLSQLAESTNWMNGIQYYLNKDVKLNDGHIMFVDSPWAITAISQVQFWEDTGYNIEEHGNGKVKGILSVDVSNWFEKGILFDKIAKDCTKEEILQEVWAQMKKGLMVDGNCLIHDDMIVTTYIDNDIYIVKNKLDKEELKNAEPLLVNEANTWSLRPEAHTNIKNFFLASDYVRTNTDLATMEGANEAARRAVNSIIQVSGSSADECEIWKLHEPNVLAVLRHLDQKRYDKGEPWSPKIPFLYNLAHKIYSWFH